MFVPIRTRRLLIRQVEISDADELWRRRNEPEVARFQNWELPFPKERATEIVAGTVAMDGPADEEWWMAIVTDAVTGETLGDLVVHLSWRGRTAEIGYTFSSRFWGRGYAVEATEALVAYLFDELSVTRVLGMLHPGNPASAMVLERVGMLFEGHTRSSFWLGDDCSDDWIYGMTRPDWVAWSGRPRHPPAEVRLVEVTAANVGSLVELVTHKTQERFVAPMTQSFTDALFPEVVDGAPVVPWLRGVVADGDLVGFVMLAIQTEHHPEPFLWRLLVDRLQQRRGIGSRVLALIVEECRTRGGTSLLTSWREGKGSPGPFYLSHGFVPTGRTLGGETEARTPLH